MTVDRRSVLEVGLVAAAAGTFSLPLPPSLFRSARPRTYIACTNPSMILLRERGSG
jgi:hypothetical protein